MNRTHAPLTGCAVGDAIGMGFETDPPTAPRLLAWDGKRYLGSDYHKLEPGQWTDDTLMSIDLATSLVRCRTYDPEDAAKEYARTYDRFLNAGLDPRGMGKSTRQALSRLNKRDPDPWWKSGVDGAEGNGTAMRAAPIGAFYGTRRSGTSHLLAAAHWARVDAGITHKSIEAAEGSAAIALAVADLVARSPFTLNGLLRPVVGNLRDSRVRFALEDIEQRLDTFDLGGGRPALERALKGMPWVFEKGPSARVTDTVPVAFAVLLTTKDFEDAVTTAVRLGGDTDTTAAIVGAMAGTFYGYELIPKRLLDGLERAQELHDWELALHGHIIASDDH